MDSQLRFTPHTLCLFCSPHGNDKMIYAITMTRAVFAIAVALLYGTTAAAPQPPVTFESAFGTQDAAFFFTDCYVAFVIDMSPQPCLDFKVIGKDLTKEEIK
jgi:hypothetical protein